VTGETKRHVRVADDRPAAPGFFLPLPAPPVPSTALQSPRILVVIPTYNEGRQILAVVSEARRYLPGADILVVDDGSTDDTAEQARAAGARLLQMPFNTGYGVAVQTGFKYAFRKGYDYVVQMDADGQHEPASLPDLLEPVLQNEWDIAIGSRFLNSDRPYHTSLTRRVGMRLFGRLASLLTRRRISDPTSGFQAFNRQVVRFYCSHIYPVDFPDADVLVMLHRAGFRFGEVPVIMYPNNTGKSMHNGLKPIYYVFKMFLSLWMTLLRDDRRVMESTRHGDPR
jgi:glycosyltransferase involved in cell wall biosynthesis